VGEYVIEASGLRKTYRSRRRRQIAVDNLDLAVGKGGVHGFLGPNGSGKTTTIRMLLGLVRPDAGTISLLGQPVPKSLSVALRRTGAVVEQPQFFPAFSGWKNLVLLARTIGVPRSTVRDALQQVGLAERAKDKYKSYSLGMKQRLAIASTLLKSPELLILDEPTNGLDPGGIREVRDTIRELGASGVTVLLSSHLLVEVQQVCDSVSIISKGKLVTSGPVNDVLTGAGKGGPARVKVGLADLPAGQTALTEAGFAVTLDTTHLLVDNVEDPASITKSLADKGLYVSELRPETKNLETVFLELTGEEGQL
jgi:ABC-type multidrug transport system ATPase subunit